MEEIQEEQCAPTFQPSYPDIRMWARYYEGFQNLRKIEMNRLRCWVRSFIPKEKWAGVDFSDDNLKDEKVIEFLRATVPAPLLVHLEAIQKAEAETQKIIRAATRNHEMWPWLRDNVPGVSEVLAARMFARLDLDHPGIHSPASIWRYAGWAGGDWRSHNKCSHKLRAVLHLIGDNIVRSGAPLEEKELPNGTIRKARGATRWYLLYAERKAYETAKNEAGDYASQAASILSSAAAAGKPIGKTTAAYKSYSVGQLPAKQIDARAKRYVVKRMLLELWRAHRDLHQQAAA